MGRSPQSGPTRLRVLGVSSLVALLAVAALELVLGAIWPAESEAFALETEFPALAADTLLVQHPERFFALAPDFQYAEEHLGRYANGDAWPFRGRPPGLSKDTKRVGFFGDSCVFGTGLDPRDTLPFATRSALAAEGWDPTRVEVLNYGVPGYSTVQTGILVNEVLRDIELDVCVLYVGAWNDQNAAMGANDIALREANRGMMSAFRRSAIYRAIDRSLGRDVSAEVRDERASFEEIRAAFRAGEPLYGTRVPEGELVGELERIATLCQERGVDLLFVAPAHPEDTARDFPRTRRDVETIRTFAQGRGLACIDAQAVLDQAAVPPPLRFIDFVHLAPHATEVVGRSVAAQLVEAWGAAPELPSTIHIRSVTPQRAPAFGDVSLEITLDRSVETPVIVVGGAPLREVRAVDATTWTGVLPANRAGRVDVLVQSEIGSAWRPDAIDLIAPTVELVGRGAERSLRLLSRPRDRARIFLAEFAGTSPDATPQGIFELAGLPPLPYELEVECDGEGVGRATLPPEAASYRGTLLAQPLVAPRGAPAENSVARWGASTTLRFDD